LSIPYVGHTHFSSPIIDLITAKYGDHFILNGTFDGVYRDKTDKRIKLMEHKTAASISTRHLPMDNQAGTYWMVAQTVGKHQGWLKKNEQIREITYNFLRKAMPDPRPRDADGYCLNKPSKDDYIEALDDHYVWEETRTGTVKYPTIPVMEEIAADLGIVVLGPRSKSQPPLLFERHPVRKSPSMRRMQLSRLQAEVIKMHAYVDGWLEVTKAPDRNSCSWCPFNDMCELHESGAGWVDFRDAMYRATDPYEDHRKSA
jgi:hypothetical protein